MDEIEDLIIQGKNLEYIIKKFNLEKAKTFTVNRLGMNVDSIIASDVPDVLVKKIFANNDFETTSLQEIKEKYFIVELIKTEKTQRKIENNSVRKKILLDLKKSAKRKLTSEIISKINNNKFEKNDFDKLSKSENAPIQKISLKSISYTSSG